MKSDDFQGSIDFKFRFWGEGGGVKLINILKGRGNAIDGKLGGYSCW